MKETSSKVQVELLAPARNALYGKVAINHGADAVYIGASNFGARAVAGNSIAEIETLVSYAHFYRAKVYATLNTLLYDNELAEAQKLIVDLYQAGIDGIIVQDMGILEMDLPPVQLIASTQTHNSSPDKVHFLENVGFTRIILARELSVDEIRAIRKQTQAELEFFVHGALCVSYSGQCYMSQAICGRSGNRGTCAQPCRSSYDLLDREKNLLVKDKHLLSLKDLNLANHLSGLLEAGITSFKIEGRLKDLNYLKNVTSHYRMALDALLENGSKYSKSSSGWVECKFNPDIERTFNRGYTTYNIHGRVEKTASLLTQKSLGKRVGVIAEMGTHWVKIQGEKLTNGDGICFFSGQNLCGTQINKVEGDRIFPNQMEGLQVGVEVFRNHDHSFEKQLDAINQVRRIGIAMHLTEVGEGYKLTLTDEEGNSASAILRSEKIPADKPALARENLVQQLGKLGETRFYATSISVEMNVMPFLKAAHTNQLRREATEALEHIRKESYVRTEHPFKKNEVPFPQKQLGYMGNVSNNLAQQFYRRHGVEKVDPAFELSPPSQETTVMTTKHCIRYQMDACPVHQKSREKFKEPLYLKDNNHIYRLEFDCKQCVMKVILL